MEFFDLAVKHGKGSVVLNTTHVETAAHDLFDRDIPKLHYSLHYTLLCLGRLGVGFYVDSFIQFTNTKSLGFISAHSFSNSIGKRNDPATDPTKHKMYCFYYE